MTSDQLQKAAREAAEKFSRAVWKGGSREFRNGRIDTREDFKAGYLAAATAREKEIEELKDALARLTRTHEEDTNQPAPALRMTPELERVLQQTIATAEHFLTMPGTVSGVGQNLLRDVRAVRAQASQPVKLEKVRRALKCGQERLNIVFLSEETTTRWNNLFYEALAELDAAEGKAETKEGK